MRRLDVFGKNKKATATVYFVLRFLVILTMIFQFIRGNYENVFMCILTLILFLRSILHLQKHSVGNARNRLTLLAGCGRH